MTEQFFFSWFSSSSMVFLPSEYFFAYLWKAFFLALNLHHEINCQTIASALVSKHFNALHTNFLTCNKLHHISPYQQHNVAHSSAAQQMMVTREKSVLTSSCRTYA